HDTYKHANPHKPRAAHTMQIRSIIVANNNKMSLAANNITPGIYVAYLFAGVALSTIKLIINKATVKTAPITNVDCIISSPHLPLHIFSYIQYYNLLTKKSMNQLSFRVSSLHLHLMYN